MANETYYVFVDSWDVSFLVHSLFRTAQVIVLKRLSPRCGALDADANYSEFVALAAGTEIQTMLDGAGSYSIFVPDNATIAAFINANPAIATAVTAPSQVVDFLKSHIASSRYAMERLMASAAVNMASGQSFELFDTGTGLLLGGVGIVGDYASGIAASNGLLFGLDGVLLPDLTCDNASPCPQGSCADRTAPVSNHLRWAPVTTPRYSTFFLARSLKLIMG